MKLGIYGDSFAAGPGPTSWTSILKSKFDTTVYAFPGTSFFWSYKNFIQTYNQFDSIIFLVTDWGRLYSSDLSTSCQICNLSCVDNALKSVTDKSRIKILQAAEDYYIYLQDAEYEMTVHRLILDKIINLCIESNKNLTLVPCMNSSIPNDIDHVFQPEEFSLTRINDLERDYFNIPHKGMAAENKDRLQNHITDENNLILAELLIKCMQNKQFKIRQTDFNFEPKMLDEYYHLDQLEKIRNEDIDSR